MATFDVKYVTFLLMVKVWSVFSVDLEEGDICSLADGSQGICKFITSCPSARRSIESNNLPNICGFRGKTQVIVCCESSNEIKSTKAPFHPTEIHTAPTPIYRRSGDISEQKCLEYAQYAYEIDDDPVLPLHHRMSRIKTLECNFEKLELVVGGTLASRKEFPHMALIGYQTGTDTSWVCGGSLISEHFVLTAAHCLGNARTKLGVAKFVKVGITNIRDDAHLQERTVSQLIFHPEYKIREKYHDIGLLKLLDKIEFNAYVRPACLPTVVRDINERAIACGWGDVGYRAQSSADLLKVVLEFFDVEECNKTYESYISVPQSELPQGVLDDSMVCAGSNIDKRNTCQGDSGGPLQIYHEDIKCMYTIVGVNAFGVACGLMKGRPGIYTRVYGCLKWIEDTVWPV